LTLSYGDARDPLRRILGLEAGARLKQIWGLDPEGEVCGAWRDIGIPRAWYMTGNQFSAMKETRAEFKAGNFAMCRYHSKNLALRKFSPFTWIVPKKALYPTHRNQSDRRRPV
jgi:hypothetical protein